MTQVKPADLVYASYFPGLGNPATTTLSFNVGSQSLTIGSPTHTQTNSLPVGSSKDIVEIRVQFPSLDSTWYLLNGFLPLTFNSSNVRIFTPVSSFAYEVDISYIFSGGNMKVTISEFLVVASSATVPAFTVNISLNRYTTPF